MHTQNTGPTHTHTRSRFAEALAGVSTIRAYRLEGHFVGVSDGLMERNAHAFVTQKLAAGWLAMRLDILGLGVLTLAGKLGVRLHAAASECGLARYTSTPWGGCSCTPRYSAFGPADERVCVAVIMIMS